MNHPLARHATALALITIAVLAGCGDGSGDDSSAANPATPAAARKSAHTLEELQAKGTRASQHHTVYVELKHPGSNEPEKSRRSIPYRFDHPTRQTVCMDPNILHGHSVEIRVSGSTAPALAVINAANPCQTVQFDKGEYEAVVQHSGSGATDEITHVFAHAGFVPTGNESVLGQWLIQNKVAAAVRSPAGPIRKAAAYQPACSFIETIALQDKSSGAYFTTDLSANNMALFELRHTAQAALSTSLNVHVVADNQLMDVYACGSNFKLQAKGGKFLKSQCGYPLFAADSIDDATEYIPHWDPDHRRLDLVNKDTSNLLKSIDRAAGLVVDPKTWESYNDPNLGTCANYPDNVRTGKPLFAWATFNAYGHPLPVLFDYSTPAAVMVAEFEHNNLGDINLFRQQRGITGIGEDITGVRIHAQQTSYHRYDVGSGNLSEFTYPANIDVAGGFVPNHQEVLVFSFGNCQKCDLTGLDLSNRTLNALDLQGSTLANATFKNANILSARFDNAIISGTDFTNARFQSVSFEGAQMSSDAGTGTQTTFDGTILQSAGRLGNFRGATINGAVFKNLDLTGALWTQSTVSNSSFDAVTFDGADLSHSTLSNNTHTGGSFVGTVFDNSTLTGVTLVVAQARNSSFKSSILSGFRVSNADFTNAKFNGTTITDSTFNYAYAVGADFSQTTWTTSSFEHAQAYSDGATVTHFDGCTVVSGSFSNSLFMQSSFNNCKFQGGSFSGSLFVASTFQGATSSSDSTQSQLSFDQALLAGADFSGAAFNAGDLTNAIISTKAGSVDLTIRTSPYVSDASPGASVTRTYNYLATTKPASTGTNTTCPNSLPGPCATDATWKPVSPPVYAGHEDPNSW